MVMDRCDYFLRNDSWQNHFRAFSFNMLTNYAFLMNFHRYHTIAFANYINDLDLMPYHAFTRLL
ncbi:hypothetical protein Plhal304r1_c047g0129021 [Plasmopara halstedii]